MIKKWMRKFFPPIKLGKIYSQEELLEAMHYAHYETLGEVIVRKAHAQGRKDILTPSIIYMYLTERFHLEDNRTRH